MAQVSIQTEVTEYDFPVIVYAEVEVTSYDNRLAEVEITDITGLQGQAIPDVEVLMTPREWEWCRERLAEAF